MNRSVGPKPSSRFAHHEPPLSSGCALTTTPFRCRSCESAFVSAKAGISVLNLVVGFERLYTSGFANVPWIAVPFDVISFTLPAPTWCRKKGLYGTRTRDCGCIAREPK